MSEIEDYKPAITGDDRTEVPNGMSKKTFWILLVIGIVVIGLIIGLIFLLSPSNNDIEKDDFKENYLMPAKPPLPVFDHLKNTLAKLRLTGTNPKLARLLEDFVKWLEKNPDQIYGLDINNPDMPSVVANAYFRNANPDGYYKFTKTHTNVNMLIEALNRIVYEVRKEGFNESYQNYVPQRLQEFDEWLNDDFPRRKRFDIAMKGSNDMPTRIVVSQIINEFVSTNQIPPSEAKDLRENVLSYLQFSSTPNNSQINYNTTPLERFRVVLKDIPDASFLTKFQHYQKVYADDPLGRQLTAFSQWLQTNPQALYELNNASDATKKENNVKALQGLVNQVINNYPDKTDLLRKAVGEQLVLNLFAGSKPSDSPSENPPANIFANTKIKNVPERPYLPKPAQGFPTDGDLDASHPNPMNSRDYSPSNSDWTFQSRSMISNINAVGMQ